MFSYFLLIIIIAKEPPSLFNNIYSCFYRVEFRENLDGFIAKLVAIMENIEHQIEIWKQNLEELLNIKGKSSIFTKFLPKNAP